MSKPVHIICFDIPYPVSHGGFFDLFYKIKYLSEAGVVIYLHCFEYGRERQPELNKYCKEVHYYSRKSWNSFSVQLPFIVASRVNNKLFKRLDENNFPIILEGTHCTYLLNKNLFPHRKILYRLHNIEAIYYRHLYKWETSVLKKAYYLIESVLLKKYEKKALQKASIVLTVSTNDKEQLVTANSDFNVQYLPLFVPFQSIRAKTGTGNFLLYHGNLAIAENQQTVYWLLKAVKNCGLKLIIAGRNPPLKLRQTIEAIPACELKINPDDTELEELIEQAHINLIFSFNETGIKLKLIHALFAGRHCIVNEAALSDSTFEKLCHICNTPAELQQKIAALQKISFTETEIELRKQILLPHFNNSANAQKLSALL